jgi:hypothetical protein
MLSKPDKINKTLDFINVILFQVLAIEKFYPKRVLNSVRTVATVTQLNKSNYLLTTPHCF